VNPEQGTTSYREWIAKTATRHTVHCPVTGCTWPPGGDLTDHLHDAHPGRELAATLAAVAVEIEAVRAENTAQTGALQRARQAAFDEAIALLARTTLGYCCPTDVHLSVTRVLREARGGEQQ
jgi:hypothetical protein